MGKRIQIENNVLEIMQRWPETVPVFLKYKTSCVGCQLASFETLSDAAAVYRIDLPNFVEELEAAIEAEEAGE